MDEYFLGWAGPGAPDFRDIMFEPGYKLGDLPPSFDLDVPSPGAPFDPSWDQSRLGSCGPFTAGEDIVFRSLLAGVSPVTKPSMLFMYYNTRLLMGTVNSDSGVNNRTMLKAIKQYGYCTETAWPYDISKFTMKPPDAAYQTAALQEADFTYMAVEQSLATMKSCLAQKQPIIFGFSVFASMMTAAVTASGDVPMPGSNDSQVGGHDVLLTGWDDATQRFKFKNHWRAWGKNGTSYGTIPYAYATNPKLANDFWTVIGNVPVVPPLPPTPPAGQFSLSLSGHGVIDGLIASGYTITKN